MLAVEPKVLLVERLRTDGKLVAEGFGRGARPVRRQRAAGSG